MELPTLGKHCSVCKQLDFLPFTCPSCHKIFCGEHKSLTAHGCHVVFDKLQPTCPLCGQIIIVKKGEDANYLVSRHIDRGCPQEEKEPSKMYPCSVSGCKTREMAEIICPDCGQGFCVQHRQAANHKCPSLNKAEGDDQKKQRLQWWWERVKQIQAGLDLKRLQSNDSQAKQITLMKNKGRATGQTSIPEGERLYLEVLYPFESKLAPKWLFVNKNHVAGRVLDYIADAGKIKNENNKPGARKLVLVDLKSGELISLSSQMRQIASDSDIIMLDYEDTYLANKSK